MLERLLLVLAERSEAVGVEQRDVVVAVGVVLIRGLLEVLEGGDVVPLPLVVVACLLYTSDAADE